MTSHYPWSWMLYTKCIDSIVHSSTSYVFMAADIRSMAHPSTSLASTSFSFTCTITAEAIAASGIKPDSYIQVWCPGQSLPTPCNTSLPRLWLIFKKLRWNLAKLLTTIFIRIKLPSQAISFSFSSTSALRVFCAPEYLIIDASITLRYTCSNSTSSLNYSYQHFVQSPSSS